MINVPASILQPVARTLAVTNTAAFLWRKLSQNPTVQQLAFEHSIEELEQKLGEVLAQDPLPESGRALAYVVLAALIIKNRRRSDGLRQLKGVEKLAWSAPLLDYVRTVQSTTTERAIQGALSAVGTRLSTATSQLFEVKH